MSKDTDMTILTEYVDFLEDHVSGKLRDDVGNPVVGNTAAVIFALKRACAQKDEDAGVYKSNL
ncbi:MAG: hypothetical protein COB50_00135 [Thiotrichales bacterium]|nr:MAG: hypothetical protein COB50_00135 [Thiotrichales bacterium]